jgi:hypothetical protein
MSPSRLLAARLGEAGPRSRPWEVFEDHAGGGCCGWCRNYSDWVDASWASTARGPTLQACIQRSRIFSGSTKSVSTSVEKAGAKDVKKKRETVD